MKAKSNFLLIIAFMLLLSMQVLAQRRAGIEDPGGDPDGSPPTPIDGGISLLIAGGTALGVYALKRKK